MTTLDRSLLSGSAQAAARDRAMLAHDLRGALHGVIGGVAMLGRAPLAQETRGQVDRIAAAARNLSCLVGDLLGEPTPPERREAYATADVARLLRHVGKRWTGEAEEQGLRFVIDEGSDLPASLRVDLGALVRAIGNLVSSALRSSWSGEVRLNVRGTPMSGLAFEVIGDGPGLTGETIAAVLGAVPPAGASIGGSARSLHVARSLCAEIGGEFRLANRPGGGVEAALVFRPELCAELAAARSEGPVQGADLSVLRVLLAEDNASSRFVTAQMLRAQGAAVSLVTDGAEALGAFERAEFDLVLVDIEMPRVTGLDVIRSLRTRGDGRASVPIVVLSATALREERERILAAGADGLVCKPVVSPEALAAALRAHVRGARVPSPEAEVAPPPDGPIADLAVFDALCAAIGPTMMGELLEKVASDLANARRDLAGALSSLDRKTIRGVSHILISVAGTVGAARLQACAHGLNIAAHGEDARGLPSNLRRCILEIDAALDFTNGRRASGGGDSYAG